MWRTGVSITPNRCCFHWFLLSVTERMDVVEHCTYNPVYCGWLTSPLTHHWAVLRSLPHRRPDFNHCKTHAWVHVYLTSSKAGDSNVQLLSQFIDTVTCPTALNAWHSNSLNAVYSLLWLIFLIFVKCNHLHLIRNSFHTPIIC